MTLSTEPRVLAVLAVLAVLSITYIHTGSPGAVVEAPAR